MSARRQKASAARAAAKVAAAAGTARTERRLWLGAAAAVLLALALAYANSFDAQFTLDNKARILLDPRVREASAERLGRIVTEDYWWPGVSGLYRPVTTLSFLVNYAVLGHGERPAGYHAVNFLLHALNVLLVFLLGRELLGDRRAALATAVLFGLHPIATESVTNLVGRADLFATTAIVGGLLLHLAAGRSGSGRRRAGLLVALALTAALGTLAKETAATLIGVVLLHDFVFRFEGGPWARLRGMAGAVRRLAPAYLAIALPLAGVFALRAWVFSRQRLPFMTIEDNPLLGTGFWNGRVTAVRVLGDYLLLLLWPGTLSADYSLAQVPLFRGDLGRSDAWALVSIVLVACVVALGLVCLRRRPAVAFLVFFAAGTLLPTANLVLLIGSIKAERFLYTPSIAFAGLLVLAVLAVARRLAADPARGERAAWAVLGLVALAYGVRTHVRNADWHDDLSLWSQTVRASPRSFKAHLSYATSLVAADLPANLDLAIRELETALAIAPRAELALLHLGECARVKGEMLQSQAGAPSPESVAWYERSRDALLSAAAVGDERNAIHRAREQRRGRSPHEIEDTRNVQVYSTLALAQIRLGDADGALESFAQARRLLPMDPGVHLGPAAIHEMRGQRAEQLRALMLAWLVTGGRADVQERLLAAWKGLGPVDGCAAQAAAAGRLDLTCPEVRQSVCAGHDALRQAFVDANEPALAEKTRESATGVYGCP